MSDEQNDDFLTRAAKSGLLGPIGLLVEHWDSVTSQVETFWDEIIVFLTGKRVAVIGQRAVGKTHLINFLHTGSLPAGNYQQTLIPEAKDSYRLQLCDLNLSLKASTDVGGSTESHGLWRDLTLESDIVLYLIRADLVIKGDTATCERSEIDIKQIYRWLSECKTKPNFIIVATHADKVPEEDGRHEDWLADVTNRFIESQPAKRLVMLAGGRSEAKIAVGSLLTPDSSANLVKQIFAQAGG